jgi:hypothetical protein
MNFERALSTQCSKSSSRSHEKVGGEKTATKTKNAHKKSRCPLFARYQFQGQEEEEFQSGASGIKYLAKKRFYLTNLIPHFSHSIICCCCRFEHEFLVSRNWSKLQAEKEATTISWLLFV